MFIESEEKEPSSYNYKVLARRTRPQSLNELIGQDHIVQALQNMISQKRIPHAFLFTGTRGTGKTSSARILAKALNCEKGPTAFPCQICTHCVQITQGNYEDVFEIDGASHTGVDNIRELKESARFFPVRGRTKVFIIDEVHMLSVGAFNALLKILEEPPDNVVFILATTELNKVPITVRSRSIVFSFKKIDTDTLVAHLKKIITAEKISYEEDAIKLIVREARGSVRDALSLLEQSIALLTGESLTLKKVKDFLGLQTDDLALKIFDSIIKKDHAAALVVLKEFDEFGFDFSLLFNSIALLFKNALLFKTAKETKFILAHSDTLEIEKDLIQNSIKSLSACALSEVFKIFSETARDLARTTEPLAWAEIAVIDAIQRSEWLSGSELLSLLKEGKKTEPPLLAQVLVQKEKQAIHSNTTTQDKVDMGLYKKFVEKIRAKNPILGAKLDFVKLDAFGKNLIQFADIPENALYLSLNPNDRELFFNSLTDFGLEQVEIRGKYFPSAITTQKKNAHTQNPVTTPHKSLSEVEAYNKNHSHMLKERELFQRASMQNLSKLTPKISFEPVEAEH